LYELSKCSSRQQAFRAARIETNKAILGCIVSGMLNDEQAGRVRHMRQTGLPDGDVLAWIKSQMAVSYDDLHEAVMLAVVREVEMAHTRR
jgi:hypothetical protein